MFDFVRERKIPIHSLQIVRQGRLALDAYFYPYAPGIRHDVASVTKSITSTLTGLAIDKGVLRGTRQSVMGLFPDRVAANLDALKRKLTIEDLLTMRAGWDCGFEPKEARLFEMRRSADWVQFMLDLPVVAEPGTRWAYCSGNCHLLSAILTKATGTNALAFARRELFAPLGIQDTAWPADANGNNHGWGDLQMHPRDMAKIGQLFLQSGRWKNRQLISEEWVRSATRAHVERTSNKDHYGYYWWVKGEDYAGMFEAVGRGGQRITVWPAKELVIVFTGGGFEPGDLAPFLLKALKSGQSSPPRPDASRQLKARLGVALKPGLPGPVSKLPALAARIAGKTFRLSGDNPSLSAITFQFDDSAEAEVMVTWDGRPARVVVGLDGVERFSTNPLVGLPQAAKGAWQDDTNFLLDLDLVGGINRYQIKFTFAEEGKRVNIALRELTDLSDEQFTGIMSE
jgi:CubicO group peptidase (beta-lactamase class C family)